MQGKRRRSRRDGPFPPSIAASGEIADDVVGSADGNLDCATDGLGSPILGAREGFTETGTS
jgi:hypothetical protein